MGSTQSRLLVSKDFTSNVASQPYQLPYTPNSMVLSNDGTTIYLGSPQGLMVVSAVNSLAITRTDITSPGTVLSVSPDNGTVVLTDPTRQTITLESSAGGVITTYGGVGTHVEWAPDSQTDHRYPAHRHSDHPRNPDHTCRHHAIPAGADLLRQLPGWTPVNPATPSSTPPPT